MSLLHTVFSFARYLVQHEQDGAVRNAVMENMPPKVAANVLLMLDHLDKVKEQERVQAEQQAAREAEEHARQQQQQDQEQQQQQRQQREQQMEGN